MWIGYGSKPSCKGHSLGHFPSPVPPLHQLNPLLKCTLVIKSYHILMGNGNPRVMNSPNSLLSRRLSKTISFPSLFQCYQQYLCGPGGIVIKFRDQHELKSNSKGKGNEGKKRREDRQECFIRRPIFPITILPGLTASLSHRQPPVASFMASAINE